MVALAQVNLTQSKFGRCILKKTLLHWNIGVHVQIVALQAVMEELLGWDTIYHACGVPTFRRFVDNEDFMYTQMEVADKLLRWSWLIIDEISMVSATLLVKIRVPQKLCEQSQISVPKSFVGFRHDRDSGDLYGVLPWVDGLPASFASSACQPCDVLGILSCSVGHSLRKVLSRAMRRCRRLLPCSQRTWLAISGGGQ